MIRRIPASVFGVFALVSMAAGCSGDNSDSGSAASPAADSSSPTDDAVQWIKGLKVGDATGLLKSKGFECSGPISFDANGEQMQQWDCKKNGDDASYPFRSVSIVAKDAGHVRGLFALFLDPSPDLSPAPAREFFKAVASLRYADGNAAAAQKWIDSSSPEVIEKTFGSALFQFAYVDGGHSGRLNILAAGSVAAH